MHSFTPTAIAEAQRRITTNPSAVAMAEHAIRTDAGYARQNHPRGAAAIDREMADLHREVMAVEWGATRLLIAEAGAATMRERRVEGDAEWRRRNAERGAMNVDLATQDRIVACRAEAALRRTAPVRAPLEAMQAKLARLVAVSVHSDDDLLAYVAAVEEAIKPVGLAVGAERRAARLRIAADRAKAAAIAVTATAA